MSWSLSNRAVMDDRFVRRGNQRPLCKIPCINFGDPSRAHPCSDCRLMDFVAPEHRAENIPCHFIPLTESGETVADLELKENQSRLEESLKQWLRKKISQIEAERAAKNTA